MATTLTQHEPHQVSAPDERQTSKSGAQESSLLFRWTFPILGVISLVGSCVLWSLKRRLWGDEVFSWIELRDASLPHLLHAVVGLGGGGMPLFYLTAWPWAHVFGFSDLSLRLYSCAGVCGAFLILLSVMRRHFSAQSAFMGVAFGLFASLIVVEESSEARGYGLYLLLCALAIAQLLRVAESARPRGRDLFLLALSQAGLVLGHVLGLVYASLLVVALVLSDRAQQRLRWGVYACAIGGWLTLLPWIPAILASAAVGHPRGWIAVPGLGDLGSALSFWLFAGMYWQLPHLSSAVVVAGWLCGILIAIVLTASGSFALAAGPGGKTPVYSAGFVLVAAPLVFYAVSVAITPIFLPRYLIPSALGVAMLAVSWLERGRVDRAQIERRAGERGRSGTGRTAVVLSAALLALPVATALLAHPQQFDVRRVDAIAAGRPILCESLKDFLVMTRYTTHPGTPEYPMDWAASLVTPGGSPADFHLMENYRREGYLAAEIPDTAQVLRRTSFVVLTNDGSWFRTVIENDPHFRWTTIGTADAGRRVVLVQLQP